MNLEENVCNQLETVWKLGYDTENFILIVKDLNLIACGFAHYNKEIKVDILETSFGQIYVKENALLNKDEFFIIPRVWRPA